MGELKEQLTVNKKAMYIKILVVILCGLYLFLMVRFDYSVYSEPIGKVVDISQKGTTQQLTLEMKNNDEKGDQLTVVNKYDKDQVYGEKYEIGDEVFLNKSMDTVKSLKRDHIVFAGIIALFCLLILIGGVKGSLSAICLMINVVIFAGMMWAYLRGFNIFLAACIASVLFSFLVLLFINGPSKVTYISFVATIATVAIVGIICLILLYTGKPVRYEYMEFLPEPYTRNQANNFFLAQIVIGCLGAVIDVSVTITSCATELRRKDPNISMKNMISSIREVADDITGTMINVVFFTNIAAELPIFMISMKNEIRFLTVIKSNGFFDVTRFLSSGIAILLAIPVSVIGVRLFMRGDKK